MTPGGSFDVDGKVAEVEELRRAASAPDLWDDQVRARAVTQRLAGIEAVLERVGSLERSIEDAGVLLDLSETERDTAALAEVVAELATVGADLDRLEHAALFFGEYDDRTAIMSIHAGAGGGRRSGLGGDDASYVHPLPGPQRFRSEDRRDLSWRGGWHQVRHAHDPRRETRMALSRASAACIASCGSALSTPQPGATPRLPG